MFDDSKLTSIRKDYPILQREIEGHPIVYLDNAATSQAPMCVVKAIEDMYFHHRANVHRGVHTLSGEATDMVEATREKVRAFINAASIEEIVFTRGTTEAINLVAATYGDRLCNGDEIILTTMEHHSNIVPWQLIGKDKRIRIRVVPINDAGEVNLDEYADLFTEQTRFVALAHVSNVLGTINPVKEMIAIAHQHGVPVLIDVHRRLHTSLSTCATLTATSTHSLPTRCMALQAWACFTARNSASTACRPTKVVAK